MRVHDFVTGAARLLHTNADTKNTLAQRRRVIKNKCMCVCMWVGGFVRVCGGVISVESVLHKCIGPYQCELINFIGRRVGYTLFILDENFGIR